MSFPMDLLHLSLNRQGDFQIENTLLTMFLFQYDV